MSDEVSKLLGLPDKEPDTQKEKVDIMYKVITNHLPHILYGMRSEVKNLKWFILSSLAIFSIVIALITCLA